MDGRTVLVTGASSGIGLEAARALAARGARVVMLVRDPARADAAAASILATAPAARLERVVADLASLAEVRRAAAEVRDRFDRLDVLLNNAGAINDRRELTVDGFERTFAVNHLAAFLLSAELRDLLVASAPARLITVSSLGHRFARFTWDDLPYGERGYRESFAYGASKLCNLWFAREAARRLAGTGVTSNALHPGAIASGFGRDGSWLYRVGMRIGKRVLLTPAKGARTSIYLASAPEVADVTGQYFVRCKVATPSRAARDDARAARLWALSEDLTGVRWP
ncbi:MAG: SDR family NAD(P)-dependent oxidoreductase [Kofleriaceae bacterium]|nr:SDR family NAD(P)-dependent oxidoreductase [Myxococcales bacterium]MCB9558949.1 SDR family NAD(P)-dependent oxidoreductase [Kofleriaceae bacterium]MCB9570493.1 SDR family NAD(P)-dependent oxidoreductase [Kofleriaceae bacterium]